MSCLTYGNFAMSSMQQLQLFPFNALSQHPDHDYQCSAACATPAAQDQQPNV